MVNYEETLRNNFNGELVLGIRQKEKKKDGLRRGRTGEERRRG